MKIRDLLFMYGPLAILVLGGGCSPRPDPEKQIYQNHFERGTRLWSEAQTLIETDPRTGLSIALTAREVFLLAALSRPGDLPVAAQVAGVSAQIRSIEQKIAKQEKEEEDLQRNLIKALEQLELLTQQETDLSLQSQKMLRKRPPASWEEKVERAAETARQQVAISAGTGEVIDRIAQVQHRIRNMLTAAYGEKETQPPTELDEASERLLQARTAQDDAREHLTADPPGWPPANTALLTASRRMQAALQLLSDQCAGQNSDPAAESGQSEWDYDKDMEWNDFDSVANQSFPMNSHTFQTALENQSLPAPNYTAEEILAREAENQAQRSQQKVGQAGANVEKNW